MGKSRGSMRARRVGIFALLVYLTVGCEDKPDAPTQVEIGLTVQTLDDGGNPVPDVTFFVNGQKYGMTDANGTHKTAYVAKVGDVIAFDVEEPRGYRVSPTQDRSTWKCPPAAAGAPPCTVKIQFAVPEREYVLLVRGQAGNEAVTLNGKKVGTTTAAGSAILRVSGVPGAKFNVKVGALEMSGAVFAPTDEVYLVSTAGVGALGATTKPTLAVAAEPPPPIEEKPAPQRKKVAKRSASKASKRVNSRRRARPAADPWAVDSPKKQERAVAVGRAEPRRVEPRKPKPKPKPPAPEPSPVEVVEAIPDSPPTPKSDTSEGTDGEALLGLLDDDQPAPEPIAVVPAAPAAAPTAAGLPPSRQRPAKASERIGAGLLDDDSEEVDRNAISKKVAIDGAQRASVSTMSKEEITERIGRIRGTLERSNLIQRQDADFLQQVGRNHSGYYEANRLLGVWHFNNKDYRLQAKALEIATRKRRYKHDPTILLSLAKAYGRQKNYRKAIKVMRRVERKMNRLKVKERESAFRFYGEMLELEFMRQHSDDPKKPNMTLLSRSIRQWEKYINLAGGSSSANVSKANATIKRLRAMQKELEL
ncbi:MAG: tetratricopeptide repeat protein [Myxococcota bacterium]|nr:tetratricopeptide repeat protein [Myxococcota bacterium]